MPKSDIVFGSEFSPAVIDLPRLLELVAKHQPNRQHLQRAIDAEFFAGKGKNADPDKTLGDNTILAMIAYKLLEREDSGTVHLTELGQDLFHKRADDAALRRTMGKHCLANLDGLRIISSIRDLMQAKIALKKESLARRLRQEGLHVPTNGKHLNILRQWLEYAGVLNPARAKSGEELWTPDEARIKELLGVTSADIEQWGELTKEQYDFARALALMAVNETTSSEVRDSAIALYGTEFSEGGLPQSVLHDLANVGLIRWEKATGGRGAKAHRVFPTEKLNNEFLEPILKQLATNLGAGYRQLSRMSLDQILEELGSPNKHKKGIALEALAFYFCRRLDLSFVQWRLRSNATGGAEVDLVVEGSRLIFSRWQVQCKNCARISTEDLAKEVGIATTIRSNVIMMVGTGEIGSAVAGFARKVMENTALHVILLSGARLKAIAENPARLVGILNDQAADAIAVKRIQLAQ